MNERNWEYKGLQLSNSSNPYKFQTEDVQNEVVYEGKIFTNENSDGVYSSNMTVWARYFDFTGVIYGTKVEKEEAYRKLKEIIKTEDFPSLSNRWFHTLKWTDKRGKNVQIQAKVYKPLVTKEAPHNMLSFSFTLLADDPLYISQIEKSEIWGIGVLWWNTLWNTLGNALNSGTNGIIVNNEWDKKAGVYIQAIWSLTNPRITNVTTGQSLKILADTTILEVDNRTKPFIITENGANIKSAKRWEYISLAPWENNIIISCENYTENNSVSVTIKFNDTYE